MKEIKKSTIYKILIEFKENYFKVGTIIIRTYDGDILYTPSMKIAENYENSIRRELDHVSWHASGRVSIKYTDNNYDIIEKRGDRQKISEIGFQEILKDIILDFKKLPQYKKKVVPLDVVFSVSEYPGPVSFNFSIVSGKLIVAKNLGQNVPIKSTNILEKNVIANTIRALGHHSGNSDKMLQYSLRKEGDTKLRTERQIFIPHDMKITNQNIKNDS
ncbi:MAG: hypothetical protein WC420_00080 [Candidatus Paceibacterota bacterium]|jgi:hypothetical protein